MARWPEGDGAGMCSGSSWPDVSVSAQVVDVSGRGARGSLGSGRSAGGIVKTENATARREKERRTDKQTHSVRLLLVVRS